MTCIYDTVQQIGVHIRRAVMETHADTDEIDDLPYPGKYNEFCKKNREITRNLYFPYFFFQMIGKWYYSLLL